MRSGRADPLAIVEAAYRVDGPPGEWLEGIAAASRPALDEGFGICIFEFHYRFGSRPEILQSKLLGVPEELAKLHRTIFSRMDPEVQTRPFVHGPCTTGSQMMGMRSEFESNELMQRFAQKFGMYDSMWITAAEPTGWGCGLHAGRARIGWASRATRARWARVAAHISAAARLRRRLLQPNDAEPSPPGRIEAVLATDGRVQHADGAAKEPDALAQLRESVLRIERARGRLRVQQPGESLEGWQGLAHGRWSLLDHFESDGRRYIVARENVPTPPGPAALTLRERQILGYAALGHDNKVIAYDLGIAHTTVRVLMARAAAKLGVRSRADAIQRYRSACGQERVEAAASDSAH